MTNVLTCVYCGMQYPEGTPPHGAKVLTDHIKVCPKHPMRQAENKINILKEALIKLIGVESRDELLEMRKALKTIPAPDSDIAASIGAIEALLITMDE